MSSVFLGNFAYFLIMFSWMAYIVQEMFITGSSALNLLSKDEGERKQIQVASGLHFDGIEVWLIAALVITFASFPLAFTTTLQHLYIPFFLILYSIIGRGLSIEFLYKLDSKKWLKSMTILLTVSSILLMLLLGIYMTNLFLGFPLGENGMEKSFVSIFNVSGIFGGFLFVVLSILSGAGWISIRCEGPIAERAMNFVKKFGVIYTAPVFVILVYMGFNNTNASIFIGDLFTKAPILFALPALTLISSLLAVLYGYHKNGKLLYIFSLTTMGLFLLTGFIGSFPRLVSSTIDKAYSLVAGTFEITGYTIQENYIQSNDNSLVLIFFITVIFFPIILGYQGWKYKRFNQKIKHNDE